MGSPQQGHAASQVARRPRERSSAMRVVLVVGVVLSLRLIARLTLPVAGERGAGPSTLQIEEAWVVRTPVMAAVEQGSHGGSMLHPDQSALDVTVSNHGPEPEALLAFSSPVVATGELQQTSLQDGTMVM
jgi:copper(I)-binding protein